MKLYKASLKFKHDSEVGTYTSFSLEQIIEAETMAEAEKKVIVSVGYEIDAIIMLVPDTTKIIK